MAGKKKTEQVVAPETKVATGVVVDDTAQDGENPVVAETTTALTCIPQSCGEIAGIPLPTNIEDCIHSIVGNIQVANMVLWYRYWFIGRLIRHIEGLPKDDVQAYLDKMQQPDIYKAVGAYFKHELRILQDARRLYDECPNMVLVEKMAKLGLVWEEVKVCIGLHDEGNKLLRNATIDAADATKESVVDTVTQMQAQERAEASGKSGKQDGRMRENKAPKPLAYYKSLNAFGERTHKAFDKRLAEGHAMLDYCSGDNCPLDETEYAAVYASAMSARTLLLDMCGQLTDHCATMKERLREPEEGAMATAASDAGLEQSFDHVDGDPAEPDDGKPLSPDIGAPATTITQL